MNAINTTLVISDANKNALIAAVNATKNYPDGLSYADNFYLQYTDGTDNYWALDGWVDVDELEIMINQRYIEKSYFPSNLEQAKQDYNLTEV